MNQTSVDGVFSFLAFACLVGLFFTAWQHLVVDAVRQRMFEIRDQALLWAYDNDCLDYDAYQEFRAMANVTIRMYENTSILRVFAINKLFSIDKHVDISEFTFLRDNHLKEQFQKLIEACVVGLILRSPVFIVLFVVTLPIAFLTLVQKGKPSVASNKMTRSLSREFEAEILLAASA